MNKAAVLQQLKQQTSLNSNLKREFWETQQSHIRLPKGAVVELIGNAKTEWLLTVLAMHSQQFVFWCNTEFKNNPTAIRQRGVDLTRIQFVTADDLQQPLRLALESGLYPFVVSPNQFDEIKTFQRFQLLAEKTKSTLFLLADEKLSSAWPISLQLKIDLLENGFDTEIEIIRQKSG